MDPINPVGATAQSVEIVWCGCEHCGAVGPQYRVAVRHAYEIWIPLRPGCCLAAQTIGIPAEDALARVPYSRRAPRLP